jgi:hypothetical protein
VRTVEGKILSTTFVPGAADRLVTLKHDGEKGATVYVTADTRVTCGGQGCDLRGLVRWLADEAGPVTVTLHRDPNQYDALTAAHFTTGGRDVLVGGVG